jgi:hypothetical protein
MKPYYPIAVVAGFVTVLLAGCAGPGPIPETPPPTEEAAPPEPAAEVCSKLTGRCYKRNEDEPITIKTDCSFHDPSGYGAKLKLAVDNSQVGDLEVEIQTKRGKCNFALKDFEQTEKEPSIVLSAKRGSCVVRIWEQDDKVSVAFGNCKDRCQKDSFDYVWPIIIDANTGKWI